MTYTTAAGLSQCEPSGREYIWATHVSLIAQILIINIFIVNIIFMYAEKRKIENYWFLQTFVLCFDWRC
jgi:hypothetical protein